MAAPDPAHPLDPMALLRSLEGSPRRSRAVPSVLAMALAALLGGALALARPSVPEPAPPLEPTVSLAEDAAFVEERSTVTLTVRKPQTLGQLLRSHRLQLSRETVLRLNPHLTEEDLTGRLAPDTRIVLFIQAEARP